MWGRVGWVDSDRGRTGGLQYLPAQLTGTIIDDLLDLVAPGPARPDRPLDPVDLLHLLNLLNLGISRCVPSPWPDPLDLDSAAPLGASTQTWPRRSIPPAPHPQRLNTDLISSFVAETVPHET